VLVEFTVVQEFSPVKKRTNRRYDDTIDVQIEDRPLSGVDRAKTGFVRAKSIGIRGVEGDEQSVRS